MSKDKQEFTDDMEIEPPADEVFSPKRITEYTVGPVVGKAIGELAKHYSIEESRVLNTAIGLLKYVVDVETSGGEVRVRHADGSLVRVTI